MLVMVVVLLGERGCLEEGGVDLHTAVVVGWVGGCG